ATPSGITIEFVPFTAAAGSRVARPAFEQAGAGLLVGRLRPPATPLEMLWFPAGVDTCNSPDPLRSQALTQSRRRKTAGSSADPARYKRDLHGDRVLSDLQRFCSEIARSG